MGPQVTQRERVKARKLRDTGMSYRAIALKMKRADKTVRKMIHEDSLAALTPRTVVRSTPMVPAEATLHSQIGYVVGGVGVIFSAEQAVEKIKELCDRSGGPTHRRAEDGNGVEHSLNHDR